MQVVLRTLCGAEQVLELDPRQAIPHVVVVKPAGASPPRAFFHQDKTDRYPRRVYLEGPAANITPVHRVAHYVNVPAEMKHELEVDVEGVYRRRPPNHPPRQAREYASKLALALSWP